MKKPDFIPQINENAKFSSSVAGLDAKTEYIVFIVDSSANELATGSDNRNIIVDACLAKKFDDDEPIGAEDYLHATVSSRAFKNAGVVTEAQKTAAMKNHVAFRLSYKLGDERESQTVNPETGEKDKYRQKLWTCTRVKWEDEEGK